MTRPDYTDITLVLDRSSSMGVIKEATIEAFNGFLASQRTGVGVARMTLIQFDDQYEPVCRGLPLDSVAPLTAGTYQPRGSTALLDAMGRAIQETGDRLRDLPEHERPGTVLFVTLTDGQENSSRQFTLHQVNDLINRQRETYRWEFVFLAANQDAIAAASQMGISASHAMTFGHTSGGTAACFDALDNQVHRLRKARSTGDTAAQVAFTQSERDAADSNG
jgi:hypothetical protein